MRMRLLTSPLVVAALFIILVITILGIIAVHKAIQKSFLLALRQRLHSAHSGHTNEVQPMYH